MLFISQRSKPQRMRSVSRWLYTLLYAAALAVSAVSAVQAVAGSGLQQRLRFEVVSMEELELEGDRIGVISTITKDGDGYMWFGGDNGLVRYDGRRFRVYQHDENNPQSLSASEVLALLVDHDGTMWVGTRKGLNRYRSDTDSFEHFFAAPLHAPPRGDDTQR